MHIYIDIYIYVDTYIDRYIHIYVDIYTYIDIYIYDIHKSIPTVLFPINSGGKLIFH